MKITKFDKSNLEQVRAVINAALKTAMADLGLSSSIAKITYGERDFHCKLTVVCGSETDAARREFEKFAPLMGIDVDAFGKVFMVNGQMFEAVGIKPRSPKYPIIGEDENGEKYKFSADVLK